MCLITMSIQIGSKSFFNAYLAYTSFFFLCEYDAELNVKELEVILLFLSSCDLPM